MLGLLWASLAAVVAHMILGMLWYGTLFKKPWIRAMGWSDLTEAEIKEKDKTAGPGYALAMLSAVIATVVIWYAYEAIHGGSAPTYPVLSGALIGFAGWAGFYVGPTFTTRFFEGQSKTLWWIGALFWGVNAVLFGVFVGLFA